MNILITGISGFVAGYLSKSFLNDGHYIIGIDRDDPSHNNYNEFLSLDLSSPELVDTDFPSTFYNIDILIHCAAAKGDFDLTNSDFHRDNVSATEGLINFINELKINSLIHYSTVAVYGHDNEKKDEDARLSPNTEYGKTKLESEIMIRDWASEDSLRNLVVLRPSVIYGKYNYANMYNLLAFLNKKCVITLGNGHHIKSVIAIENLVEITRFCFSNKGINIYNCTDEPYYTLKELIDIISEVEGFNSPSYKIPFFLAWFIVLPIDIISRILKKDFKLSLERLQKFKTATDYRSFKLNNCGYVQKFSTKESLKKMAKWFILDKNNRKNNV